MFCSFVKTPLEKQLAPLQLCPAEQQNPLMNQTDLAVQLVSVYADLRTEEEVMGKAQLATQHSHLVFHGT